MTGTIFDNLNYSLADLGANRSVWEVVQRQALGCFSGWWRVTAKVDDHSAWVLSLSTDTAGLFSAPPCVPDSPGTQSRNNTVEGPAAKDSASLLPRSPAVLVGRER